MDFDVQMVSEELTDGSAVHAVLVSWDIGQKIKFNCIDETSAEVLADTIKEAVSFID